MAEHSRLDAMLLASAEANPQAVLVHYEQRNWTYEETVARAGALAHWLGESGVRPGDRVVLALPNGPDYVAAYFGIQLAGAVVVAVNPAAFADELEFVLQHAEARALCIGAGVAWRDLAPGMRTLRAVVTVEDGSVGGAAEGGPAVAKLSDLPSQPEVSPACERGDVEALAQIIYTSGTTGRPKGVMLSHRNLCANTRSITTYLRLSARDGVLVILPFFYSYGNSLLLTHVAVGGRLVVARDFVFWNQALDLAQRERITGFAGVPMSYAMLLHRSDLASRRFPDLRYMTCAGGALARPLIERLREILPHVDLFVMYGQTEASARLTSLLPHELDRKPGSVGRPIPGVEITIRDEQGSELAAGEVGEVVARGDNVMAGFWRDPAATGEVLRAEGLYTKDAGWQDEDGYLWIVGRKDDVIKSGSYRISPEELEQAMLAIPGVREVAVVGEPDPFLGEAPVAFAVVDGVQADEVLQAAQRRIPRYKCVRSVRLVAELPRTRNGKVRRGVLRERLREQPATEGQTADRAGK